MATLTSIVNNIIQKVNNLTFNKVNKVTSTDNAIVRYNGTTGDVQNSSVIVDDSGNITGVTSISGKAADSDLLDGKHATDFMQSSGMGFITDLNNLLQSGCYRINTPLNRPAGVDYGNIIVMHGGGTDTVAQIVTDYSSNHIYWRSGSGYGAIWGAWRRILSDSNALTTAPLGYVSGVGVGATVIQGSLKTDTVYLNKLTGEITTSNSALAGNTVVYFFVGNSYISAGDLVVTSLVSGVDNSRYNVWTSVSAIEGGFYIIIKNITSTSLSEAIKIKFSVFKGANS